MPSCLLLLACLWVAQEEISPDAELPVRVRQLVRQLDDDDLLLREAAEKQLTALGPQVLQHLPTHRGVLSAEVASRLERVRNRLQHEAALASTRGSTVTLRGDMRFSAVLEDLQRQTGNQLVDYRQRFGQEPTDPLVHCNFDQQPYWAAVDHVLDRAGLQLYSYTDTPRTMAFVARSSDHVATARRLAYAGPIRFQATRVEASRDLRNPVNTGLIVSLEIAWEPKVQPIMLVQSMDSITALDDRGDPLPVDNQQATWEFLAHNTMSAAEMDIPLRLPPRAAGRIASLRGTLEVVFPGREAEFRFEDLANAENVQQQQANVTVVLQSVRRTAALHDVRILVRFGAASGALESHRGWIYDNDAYLVDAAGNRQSHAGFEMTAQGNDQVGLSYKFLIDNDLAEYAFVYKTPAAVIRAPVAYQLQDIELP